MLHLIQSIDSAYQHLFLQIKEQKDKSPFYPVSILLPSSGATLDLRSRMKNTIGVSIFEFYRLGQAILESAAVPT